MNINKIPINDNTNIMKNYIIKSTGEIKEAEVLKGSSGVLMVQYYDMDGPHRCIRVDSEVYKTKKAAKQSLKS